MYEMLSRESLCAGNQTLNGQLVLLVNHLGNKKTTTCAMVKEKTKMSYSEVKSIFLSNIMILKFIEAFRHLIKNGFYKLP